MRETIAGAVKSFLTFTVKKLVLNISEQANNCKRSFTFINTYCLMVFENDRHVSFPGFTELFLKCFISFRVSVENVNIGVQDSSRGDFKAHSENYVCRIA